MALLSWGFGAKNYVCSARFTERLDARTTRVSLYAQSNIVEYGGH
jgi:hypothetical protein